MVALSEEEEDMFVDGFDVCGLGGLETGGGRGEGEEKRGEERF